MTNQTCNYPQLKVLACSLDVHHMVTCAFTFVMYHYKEVYFSSKLLAQNTTNCNNSKLTVSVLVLAARVKQVYKKLEIFLLQHTHVYMEDSLKLAFKEPSSSEELRM